MPPPIPAPRESGFTTTTAEPLFWVRYGPAGAPPMVLLHGGPGASHDYLLPQLLHFAERHDVLLYDQRGGGRSRTSMRTPVTWRSHVEDLAAVLAELEPGDAPLRLGGYSWGALLALLHLIEQHRTPGGDAAARLSHLLLISPAPISRVWREEFERALAARSAGPAVQALRDELAASGLRERDPEAHRQRAFELSVAGYFADPRRARDLTPFRVLARVQQEVWASLGDFDVVPDLARAAAPAALVVHGREDPIPLASSEACAGALGAPLVVLDDCGHVPYVEQAGALFAAADPFLAAASPQPRPAAL